MRYLALLAALTACSHQSAANRSPSSIHTLGPAATLDEIEAARDPRAEARAYVNRLLVLRLRSHGWMLEFDRAFENAAGPIDLFSQPAYLKLLIAHPFSERMEHKISALYHGARAQAKEHPELADRAALVVAGVDDALLHARHNVAERVLLNHLMRELHDGEAAKLVAEPPHPLTVPLEGEELVAASADTSDQLEQMNADLPASDEVSDEVDSRAKDLAAELTEDPGREPQSLSFFPSLGKTGGITGLEFPRGTWALTFDDGPSEHITAEDLANLQAAHVKGTFFWLAKNVTEFPDVVKKVIAAGFPVEDHSWNHPQLDKPADLKRLHTTLQHEINDSFALETKVYGQKPRFFRCPYGAGARNPVIRGMIAKLGMIHVFWDVDSLDWQDPNPASVQKRVEKQMAANGRGIILFHDIHTPALKVVPNLIAENKGKVRWVTIPQIIDELNGPQKKH